ncbi:uncharacterized protein LOC132579120 isoform X2 [Heteronotia binoei]|uniref:uncharacterized protein LOC132579120 isoform X2 n=1 Tax=Heteronotia binoei TaxID=13085 RepID=UPI0029311E71|nr:uncharacterized protein LOC132579120 isoform X2 [Heteronotia binoei]
MDFSSSQESVLTQPYGKIPGILRSYAPLLSMGFTLNLMFIETVMTWNDYTVVSSEEKLLWLGLGEKSATTGLQEQNHQLEPSSVRNQESGTTRGTHSAAGLAVCPIAARLQMLEPGWSRRGALAVTGCWSPLCHQLPILTRIHSTLVWD